MKILIVGGVAAGTKIAAKLKREQRDAEVRILTMGKDISYAGCGLPYYVGDVIKTRDELVVNTPEAFMALTGAEVRTGVEVTGLDRAAKAVTAVRDGHTFSEGYDKLIIATGAVPFVPQLPGVDLPGVFCMRAPDDAIGLRGYVQQNRCRSRIPSGLPEEAAGPYRLAENQRHRQEPQGVIVKRSPEIQSQSRQVGPGHAAAGTGNPGDPPENASHVQKQDRCRRQKGIGQNPARSRGFRFGKQLPSPLRILQELMYSLPCSGGLVNGSGAESPGKGEKSSCAFGKTMLY